MTVTIAGPFEPTRHSWLETIRTHESDTLYDLRNASSSCINLPGCVGISIICVSRSPGSAGASKNVLEGKLVAAHRRGINLAERFAEADAGMWAAAHAMARGVELEPVAAEPETGPVRLKVYEPDPVPEKPDVLTEVELPEFDEALLAKMFANRTSHGMTLQDLGGPLPDWSGAIGRD